MNKNQILELCFVLGRILLTPLYVVSSVESFLNLPVAVGYAAVKGVPMPEVLVPVAMLLIIFGGLSVLLGFYPRVGIALLAAFLVPVTLTMHNFWALPLGEARMLEYRFFLSNLALLGSTLLGLMVPQPWPLSLDEWLAVRKTKAMRSASV